MTWLTRDHPDALGETACFRASTVAWCLLLVAVSVILRKVIR